MTCQHSKPEELLAFALDHIALSPAARQHFDSCSLCQHQVSGYQKMADHLIPKLYRSRCPSATALSYYCLPGMLSEAEKLHITGHIALCPLCASEVAEAEEFLEIGNPRRGQA